MKNADKGRRFTVNKKTMIILIGSLVGAALLIWIGLITGIIRKAKDFGKGKADRNNPAYEIGEVPEGYALVFRPAEEYDLTETGKRKLSISWDYDEFGRVIKESRYSRKTVDCSTEYTYNSNGTTASAIAYNAEGEITSGYIYNEQGLVVEVMKDQGIPSIFYTYNENGDLLREVHRLDDGTEMVWTDNTYSEDGKILESFDGCYDNKVIYFYDDEGRLLKKQEYDDENRLHRETVISDGTISEMYFISGDGSRELEERTEYNDRGQIIRRCTYGYSEQEFLYVFDENGVEIEGKHYYDGTFRYWVVYEYDEISAAYGKTSKTIFKNEDGSSRGYIEQQFSKNGQRIRQFYYNADGSFQDQGEGYIGYYMDVDSYGNAIRWVSIYGEKERVVQETDYQPFIIPLQYLNEKDIIMLELSKEQRVLK